MIENAGEMSRTWEDVTRIGRAELEATEQRRAEQNSPPGGGGCSAGAMMLAAFIATPILAFAGALLGWWLR